VEDSPYINEFLLYILIPIIFVKMIEVLATHFHFQSTLLSHYLLGHKFLHTYKNWLTFIRWMKTPINWLSRNWIQGRQ